MIAGLCKWFGAPVDIEFWRNTEWGVFTAWLESMHRQQETASVSPDSWDGAEGDQWWANVKQQRSQERANR